MKSACMLQAFMLTLDELRVVLADICCQDNVNASCT